MKKPSRTLAVTEASVVILIWASSFVLVKIALKDFGPLTIAGLRYFLAALILFPFLLRRRIEPVTFSKPMLLRLAVTGIGCYTVGNGALFWGLQVLPATTGSFLMSFMPLLMLFMAMAWLKEIPTRWQVIGVVVALLGSGLFFSMGLQPGEPLGVIVILLGQVGFLVNGLVNRDIARKQEISTLALTAIPLAIGGGLTLLLALIIEGVPPFAVTSWGIVLLLAVVNTAMAYLLYNHALRTLTALEMNIILNLSPLGTAVLAWILLSERLNLSQWIGIIVVIGGVALVQSNSRESIPAEPEFTKTPAAGGN